MSSGHRRRAIYGWRVVGRPLNLSKKVAVVMKHISQRDCFAGKLS